MLMPALFGETLIDDFLNDFSDIPFFNNGKHVGKTQHPAYGSQGDKPMRTDIRETENAYLFSIDLPGFQKENIQASIENGYLTISAKKTAEEDNAHYLRKERYSGSLQRTFFIGEDITQEEVKAQFQHGVLHLTVPKKKPATEEERTKYIAIES